MTTMAAPKGLNELSVNQNSPRDGNSVKEKDAKVDESAVQKMTDKIFDVSPSSYECFPDVSAFKLICLFTGLFELYREK